MIRFSALFAAALIAAGAASAAPAAPRLERVVLVMRHGIRPPTSSNAELAKFAAEPWPDWPVKPGELTPHGGDSVTLMGKTLRARYAARGLIPAKGCAGAGRVSVWADGTDQRTRRTGELLSEALQPGCGVKTGWAAPAPRDPIFAGPDAAICKPTADQLRLPPPSDAELASIVEPTRRLQSIVAPKGCSGGPGACFSTAGATAPKAVATSSTASSYAPTTSLAEDLYLEYIDGKPLAQVGWGRAKAADITDVMRIHEATWRRIRADRDLTTYRGAPMAEVVLAALKSEPAKGGPQSGPDLKILGLAGHDSNLAYMSGLFGLTWTLKGQPEFAAPSTVLAFELWKDHGKEYVRPVVYYETMEQMRSLKPAPAQRLPLTFAGCADGPNRSCALPALVKRAEAVLPKSCG